MRRRFTLAMLVGTLAITTAATFGCACTPQYDLSEVSISPAQRTIRVGDTFQFQAVGTLRSGTGVEDAAARSETFDWSVDSSGEGVENLGQGRFRGLRPGTYKVSAVPHQYDEVGPTATLVVLAANESTDAESTPPGDDAPVALYEEKPPGEPVEIFRVGNDLAVYNGGTSPTVEFSSAHYLTEITTYHWNESKGTPAGTIALKGGDGKTYGPWKAHVVNGVYWVANPNVTVPAGSYSVIDSDPRTWAQNSECGGKGMTWASGIPSK